MIRLLLAIRLIVRLYSSLALVVGLKDLPASGAHEAGRRVLTILGHLAHAGAGDELKVFLDAAGTTEELHRLADFVVCGNLEGQDLDTLKHRLAVDEEFLAVPDVVKRFTFDRGVTDTSGVSSGDEVGDATVNTGGGVPQDLSRAAVVHGGRPGGDDCVFRVEGTVGEKSGVLRHAVGKGNVVILAPATERVEKEDRVPVASFDELLTGILEEEDVTVVEGVPDLESVDDIGVLLIDLGLDLGGGHPESIVAVVEHGPGDEAHRVAGDEEFTLGEDGLSARVVLGHAAEGASADLLLAVVVEDGGVDNGEDILRSDSGAFDGDLALALEGGLLLSSHRLGDGNREEVALALGVSDGLHVHDLEELELVHEAVEGVSPAVTDGLEVLDLMLVDVQDGEGGPLSGLLGRGDLPHGLSDDTLLIGTHDAGLLHVVDDLSLAGGEREGAGVDVQGRGSRGLVGSGDTSEVGDDTIASLLVETLDITALTDFEGGADVALVELEAGSLVNSLGEVSVCTVR